MKYFVLLAGNGELEPWDEMTPEAQQQIFEQFGAFDAACESASDVETLGGEALEGGSMATTLRTRNGELSITDGPYAEATEQIGGYFLIEAPDLDTITDLCRSLPAYDIEIRPVVDIG
ncbi:MAG: YciI family protein [Acidimicrobiia bacterium]|nr:YciI family protein [Acidimicrobiia bacterium]